MQTALISPTKYGVCTWIFACGSSILDPPRRTARRVFPVKQLSSTVSRRTMAVLLPVSLRTLVALPSTRHERTGIPFTRNGEFLSLASLELRPLPFAPESWALYDLLFAAFFEARKCHMQLPCLCLPIGFDSCRHCDVICHTHNRRCLLWPQWDSPVRGVRDDCTRSTSALLV